MSMDFDDEFFRGLAKEDFDACYFRPWRTFKKDMETEFGANYGIDFDEATYTIYEDYYKYLCEINGEPFDFE